MAKVLVLPRNADEMREQLSDKEIMRDFLKDPVAFAEYVEGSIQERIKHDPEAVAQTNKQTEDFMIQWLKDHETDEVKNAARRLDLSNPSARGRVKPHTLYNKSAAGAPFDNAFKDAAEMLHSISEHAFKNDGLTKKLESLKDALSSAKPSDGGFLIPEMLRAELLRTALEKAIVRSRARLIPMDSLTVPFPTVDSTSNVSSIFGGVTGFWTEEGATLTESAPKFGRVELRAQKLTLYMEMPNELIRDARPSMEALVNDMFPEAIAWFEDVAFFVGGGVGEPLGILNAPCRIQVTRDSGGNAVEWLDIVSMYCRMLPQSLDRAVWLISPDVMPQLLSLTTETGVSVVWVAGGQFLGDGTANPPMRMLGLPIIVSEKCRAVGTAGDVNLVDFGFYLIGDRQAMSARQSEDFKFNTDVTAFRVTERIDGRPWLKDAITPQNGGSTLSPIIQLL